MRRTAVMMNIQIQHQHIEAKIIPTIAAAVRLDSVAFTER